MKTLAVIPARFASSRFAGKPLAPILGIPMVVRVARIAAEAVGHENTCVATDDERIAAVVRAHGFDVQMTSSAAFTGTDRIAEVARERTADVFINLQGDEPMVDPSDIVRVLDMHRRFPYEVVNAMCPLGSGEDPDNPNIIKVVPAADGRLLYMSRRAVPGFKDSTHAPARYWKQVCIYAFTPADLHAFAGSGRTFAESCEDVEILRFLDLGVAVRMVEVSGNSLAVDNPADVALVERALRMRRSSLAPPDNAGVALTADAGQCAPGRAT